MSPFVVINLQRATCHAGFYVLYLVTLLCRCIFEVLRRRAGWKGVLVSADGTDPCC